MCVSLSDNKNQNENQFYFQGGNVDSITCRNEFKLSVNNELAAVELSIL